MLMEHSPPPPFTDDYTAQQSPKECVINLIYDHEENVFTQYTFALCIYLVTNLETQLTLHVLSTRIQIQLKSTFKHDAQRQLAAINASDQSINGKIII